MVGFLLLAGWWFQGWRCCLLPTDIGQGGDIGLVIEDNDGQTIGRISWECHVDLRRTGRGVRDAGWSIARRWCR